jgi:hypothetical protein
MAGLGFLVFNPGHTIELESVYIVETYMKEIGIDNYTTVDVDNADKCIVHYRIYDGDILTQDVRVLAWMRIAKSLQNARSVEEKADTK